MISTPCKNMTSLPCVFFYGSLEFCENDDRHTRQEYVFSPVCVLIWVVNVEFSEKDDTNIVFPPCAFSYGALNKTSAKMMTNIYHKNRVSFLCLIAYESVNYT